MLTLGRAIQVLDSGNHHPILCELECDGSPAGQWVVKPQYVESISNNRLVHLDLVAELAGAEVCAWAGVRCPAIGLLRFPEGSSQSYVEGVSETHQGEVASILKINAGKLAFCSSYLQGAIDIDPDTLKGRSGEVVTKTSGAVLFAVDAYLRHDDRRRDNPNAVWFENQVVALDHGAAFTGFSNPQTTGEEVARRTVFPNPKSVREHIFYDALARLKESTDWQAIGQRLADVPDGAIEAAALGWPEELEPARSKLLSYLRTRREVVVELMDNVSELFTGGQAHA